MSLIELTALLGVFLGGGGPARRHRAGPHRAGAPVPGALRLLGVEDTFDIQGRGVIVAPDVDQGARARMELRVAPRRPDGDVLRAVALARIPLDGRSRNRHVLCFRTLSKQDLPVGTEVWLLGEVEST